VYVEDDRVRVVPLGELDLLTAGRLDEQLRELAQPGFACSPSICASCHSWTARIPTRSRHLCRRVGAGLHELVGARLERGCREQAPALGCGPRPLGRVGSRSSALTPVGGLSCVRSTGWSTIRPSARLWPRVPTPRGRERFPVGVSCSRDCARLRMTPGHGLWNNRPSPLADPALPSLRGAAERGGLATSFSPLQTPPTRTPARAESTRRLITTIKPR